VLISVVCPVYCHTEEHKEYLREALESVANQTYRVMELVVVDDGSPIDIMPIIETVKGLPSTRILRNTANLGHAQSRNVGIQAAEGDAIAFLDHDDVWLPEKLEAQAAILKKEPEVAMTFCDSQVFWQNNTCSDADQCSSRQTRKLYFDQSKIPERPTLAWLMTHRNCVITVSSVLVRKHALLDIGMFDSRYSTCDDYDAWLKIRSRWQVYHLPRVYVRYRLHKHNTNYAVDHLKDNRLITELMINLCKQLGPIDRFRVLPTLARKTGGRIYWSLRRR